MDVPSRLDARLWIGFEVPVPARILWLAIVGSTHHQILAVAHVQQGMRAKLAAFPPNCVQQEHGKSPQLATYSATRDTVKPLIGPIDKVNKRDRELHTHPHFFSVFSNTSARHCRVSWQAWEDGSAQADG